MLVGGCHEREQQGAKGAQAPRQNPAASSAGEKLDLGRRIYNFRCYYCHGYSGDARTLAATYLNPKPLDFTRVSPDQLGRERMLLAIQSGKPGTAMKGFAGILQPQEIAAVTDFVRQEFMVAKAQNTLYHTAANGWPNHERYAAAFPFATGKVPLDTPWEQLAPQQAAGKRLFLAACVSCHDRAHVDNEGLPWETRPLSYPRNHFSPGDNYSTPDAKSSPPVDAMTSASPYLLHDRPPRLSGLTAAERRGETLYQQNCAFCHAADGTARNWIGSFMEPHPRDLTSSAAMSGMTKARLERVIREGLPGTSMPAWESVLPEPDVKAVAAYVGRAFHPLGKD
ncbi:MAG: c-type cytochrome [Hydrogenophilales bacterium]|nr:c-type cytochrome [Hydrogenophilales bacterium]